MKHLKSFNESIRSYMSPKTDEEIEQALMKLPPLERIKKGVEYGNATAVESGLASRENTQETLKGIDHYLLDSVLNNDIDVARVLLNYWASANNQSVMENAFKRGNLEMLDLLILEHGADFSKVRLHIYLESIYQDKNTEALKFVLEHTPKLKQILKAESDGLTQQAEKINKYI